MNVSASLASASSHSAFAPLLQRLPFERLRPLLQRVAKPGRYVGGEYGRAGRLRGAQNRPPGDPEQVRALLSYPDTYELGMSNEGLRILYDRINRSPAYLADRAFLPWPDFAQELKNADLPLYSLDHFLAPCSFDLWGFNTAHELHYTNLCYALDLANIPILRLERRPQDPLVIAGGTAVSNPLPLFDFMDGIFLGDGEEAIIEICDVIAAGKRDKLSRQEILKELQQVEGLLLPHFYHITDPQELPQSESEESFPESGLPSRMEAGLLAEQVGLQADQAEMQAGQAGQAGLQSRYPLYRGRQVKKRSYRAKSYSSLEYFQVPNVEISQDRVVIEVARGCGQGCRFCHAGFWKRPVRNLEVDTLVRSAGEMLAKTGRNSISLHSLSIADYPWLEELTVSLAQSYGQDGISLSLPSLRVQVKTIPILEMTSNIRRSSVTFALEAGSELMRERIRKKSSEENLHYLVREIFDRGWELIKVYFMIGLPDPEGQETNDLVRALNALGDLAKEYGPRKRINVTISLFVPKPFTTFQWERQQDPAYFHQSLKQLRKGLRSRQVALKGPDPDMPYVEGLLTRSDHRVGRFILEAYRRGAIFDSWDDQFRRDIWNDIMQEIPDEWKRLWLEQKPSGSPVPWHSLVVGPKPELLVRDHNRFSAVTTENMNPPHRQALQASDFPPELLQPVEIPEEKFSRYAFLKICYGCEEPFIYVGHLDMVEVFRKACRRARLPMTFSQGFNKQEKFHFGEPLPLYFFSEEEIIYLQLYRSISLEQAQERLRESLPTGILLNSLQLLPKLPKEEQSARRYRLTFKDRQAALQAYEKLENAPEFLICLRKESSRRQKGKKQRRHKEQSPKEQSPKEQSPKEQSPKEQSPEEQSPEEQPHKEQSHKERFKDKELSKDQRKGREAGWATGQMEGLRRVERRLSSALQELCWEEEQRSVSFAIDPPSSKAISVSDLLTFYLDLPTAVWNSSIRITRLADPGGSSF